VGIHIARLDSGRILYDRESDKLFIPASNVKLLTTACALAALGPSYEFKTAILKKGPLRAGCLRGDLVVRGAGDPNLSGRFYGGDAAALMRSWARRLRALGLFEIEGDVVADDRIFDREHLHPDWPRNQLHKWYCAEVSGLSLNDNCVDLIFEAASKIGHPARIYLEPDTAYISLTGQVVTTAKKGLHLIDIQRRPGTNQVRVKGRFYIKASPFRGYVTVTRPEFFFATVLKEQMEKEGIRIKGGARAVKVGEDLGRLDILIQHTSLLSTTIAVTNKRSQNLYAECLFKLLGHRLGGEGSFRGGQAAIGKFLIGLGIPRGSFVIADGSGLSASNRLSPRQIVSVLRWMARGSYGEMYRNSLSTAGLDGTLRKRFRGPDSRGRVLAKTGTLAGVSALSGYCRTGDGKQLVFSILMNRLKGGVYRARKIQDEIVRLLLTR
jgi:D-alanyl-D-alanine carboxypeptidase/D-alanyl-D-alanine-endopeptidase (penicillin-binding protein 4)